MERKTIGKLVVGVVGGILGLVLLLSCFTTVESGHVGVVKSLGAVQKESLAEGFHFKKPWDSVIEVETRLHAYKTKAGAASKDLQSVTTEITVQYSQRASMAPETYQKIGDKDRLEPTVMAPAVQESLKSITAKFTAEELVTRRQQVKAEVEDAIKTFIQKTLQDKGVSGAIDLANIAITDFEFSPDFNHAIEAKVKAEQEALKAENDKKKRITEAEAGNAEKKLEADAKAYSTEVESKARAAAIQREAEALKAHPNLIQLRAAERWDGHLPVYMGGQQPIPFMNIGATQPAPIGSKSEK